jgi:glycosyltransferase involved in cell wall biosynthesis
LKNKNLCIVIGSDNIGGTEIQIEKLVHDLTVNHGYIVNIIITGLPNLLFLKEKINFSDAAHKYFLFHSRFIPNIVSNVLFSLIIRKLNNCIFYIIGAGKPLTLLKHLIEKKQKYIVVGIRNQRFIYEPTNMNFLKKYLLRDIPIITNAIIIKDSLIKHKLCNRKTIHIIRNGIDVQKNKKNVNDKIYRIMFCGNFREVKNPMFFLKVVKSMIREYSDINFIIVGSGPLKDLMHLYISQNRLSPQIEFFGQLKKEAVPYKKVDLLFNCSESEGSSNSILEALSFGVPVVASDNPGNQEILYNNDFGYLFNNNNINDAKRGILKFYDRDEKKIQIDKKLAINFINKSYSINLMVENHLNIFNWIINKT